MPLASPPFAGLTCLAEQGGPTPLGAVPERAAEAWVSAYDGTRLSTDVYLPRGRGPFSTVLCRLPYDKTGDHAWVPAVAERLVQEGFAFVAQDVRGKARSAGLREPFVHESADGAATLDWIEAQRWSNGRVGMWGQSYFGYTQWAAAVTGHRALRCIVPQMTATAIGTEWMYRQGVFQLQAMAEWGAWAWTEERMLGVEVDWRVLPAGELVRRWCGRANPQVEAWMRDGPRSRRWSALPAARWEPRDIRAAVLSVGGFWDVFHRGQIRDYRRLRVSAGSRAALRMASRDHYGSEWAAQGHRGPDYEHDGALLDEALERYVGPAPAWYRAWLDDERAPTMRRVAYQVAGDGWHHADTWPPRGARRRTLWLTEGRLADRPGPSCWLAQWHDPADPVPSLDENPWRVLFDPPDRRALAARGDVAVFDTQPLRAPLTLAGPAVMRLPVEVDRSPVHIHSRLVDVAPDGCANLLTHGAARVSASRLLSLDLGHLAIRLDTGHRLRLEISPSDFPRYPLATSGGDWQTATRLRPFRLRCGLGSDSTLEICTLAETAAGAPLQSEAARPGFAGSGS